MSGILIVDDEPDTATLLRDSLRRRGYLVDEVHSGDACLSYMKTRAVDVVVTDIKMPGMSGLELVGKLREEHPEVLSIIVTGVATLDNAIEAIRVGAYDFIAKPVKADALAIAVGRAMDTIALRHELHALRSAAEMPNFDGIVGTSAPIREMIEMIKRVAASDATVLVTGASGTGKELVARAVHSGSSRRDRQFVAFNCAAIPAPLLESELFGHVRGAFTDAKHSRPGLFVEAGSGTVFLDEIAEMPLELQVKLLRVLQERKLRPVGSDEEVEFDARVIAASNRDLEQEVAEKRFREDLYYRINVVGIQVPPLRTRAGDVLLLAQFFLKRAAARNRKPVIGISAPAARMLVGYDWPGNVRELENCMERAVALCRLDEITVDDLPIKVREYRNSNLVVDAETLSELITLDEMERRYVRHVLERVNGNKTHAARALGIDRRSLYRRLEAYPVTASTPAIAPDDAPAPAKPADET
jgi:DNA-binding NtrC family response regulator